MDLLDEFKQLSTRVTALQTQKSTLAGQLQQLKTQRDEIMASLAELGFTGEKIDQQIATMEQDIITQLNTLKSEIDQCSMKLKVS